MDQCDVLRGLSVYLRNMHAPHTPLPQVEKSAVAFLKRAHRMKLSWVAIGAVWQDSATQQKFLNSPEECEVWRKVIRDGGITPYAWGYPWLGGEQKFVDGMLDCAGDDGLVLLDPELGMNPTRNADRMDNPNTSATLIVHGLRAGGANKVGLSTFGGIPKWFPLRAFLKAGVDFAGGQTYSQDKTIDTSIASFLTEMKLCRSTAQLVPNYGLYMRTADGKTRSKTPVELRTHFNEFINEGEPVHAAIGWAENFLDPVLEPVIAEFAERFRSRP